MKTNFDILATSVTYLLIGLGLFFAPDVLLQAANQEPSLFMLWLAQVLGAAMLGMGWMNYLNKTSPIGGIYGRPLLLQNLMFAFPSFIFSFKSWQANPDQIIFLYAAVVFGLIGVAIMLRFLGKGPVPASPKA